MLWASKSSCRRFCLSRPKQPFPHSRSLCLPCGHQTREGACAGFTCARPSARALNVQAAGQHLAGISCTHMGAHIWAMVAELVGGGPLPAHSPSLPFARLQTPQTPKTLQFLRGSFHQAWPSAFAAPGLQPALWPAHPSRQLPPSSWPSAFQHCSLPFACT